MIDSPSFGIPTPTNGAPPPGRPPFPDVLLAIPAAEPNVFPAPCPGVFDELSEPSVAGPFVAPLVELPPPNVGKLVPPNPLAPGDEDPKPLPEDEDPNPLLVDEDPKPLEPEPAGTAPAAAPIPADGVAEPNPPVANPASGAPKNPFTVVFASPTWISRQSAFPVIGST